MSKRGKDKSSAKTVTGAIVIVITTILFAGLNNTLGFDVPAIKIIYIGLTITLFYILSSILRTSLVTV